MIKYVFLGINGSSQERHGGNTSILISGDEGKAAVDLSCNMAVLAEADIDGVILTHEHIDHIYALPSLLHQLWIGGRKRQLSIYIPKGMEGIVEALLAVFDLRSKPGMFEIRVLAEEAFDIGTLHITTFKTDHTKTSMGIVVEEEQGKLVYTSDTRPIEEIPALFQGADVLVHEASGLSVNEELLIKKGHASGADAGKMAERAGAEALYLCHLPKADGEKKAILQEARERFAPAEIPELLREYSVEAAKFAEL